MSSLMDALPYRYPSIDDNLNWLHEHSWALSYICVDGTWLVRGTRSGQSIFGTGEAIEDALSQMCQQLRSL